MSSYPRKLAPGTKARYDFFRKHAGYSTPPGRDKCALALALAEEKAEELGLWVHWEPDDMPWDGDCPAPRLLTQAAVYRAADNAKDAHTTRWEGPAPKRGAYALAALGGIGHDSWSDPYLRVASAELFLEALQTIDSLNTQEAALLAERATYAAGG